FLNSKIIFWYLKQIGHLYSDTGFLVSNQYVERLPIPKISKEKEAKFVNLMDKILKETDENERANLSSEIDKLVYQIYDLSADEIALIENA
ncbi:MAG: hypothetical protein J6W17_02925, partial [Campylobacter sp.]|nr:hypothetical protein [Campylobacter sp.]